MTDFVFPKLLLCTLLYSSKFSSFVNSSALSSPGFPDDDFFKLYLVPPEDQNVALVEKGASMVKPGMGFHALEGTCEDDYDPSAYSQHSILGDNDEAANPGIVINLKQPYLLNRLKVRLLDKGGDDATRGYSYYAEVSLDGEQWTVVANYTKYTCRSWQYLVFPEMVVKFIRIAGTYSAVNNFFEVVCVNAYLSRKKEILDINTGLWVPSSNVATPARGARVLTGWHPENLLNGQTTGYDAENGVTKHALNSTGFYIQLPQPVVLSSMRLLLWDLDDRKYNYQIHVSIDRSRWTCVSNPSDQRSWQIVQFPPIPVVFIRIMGTLCTRSPHCNFVLVHFECPAAEKPVKALNATTN